MKRSSGARMGAAVAVSVLSLALTTGCGGDSGAKDAKAPAGEDSPSAASTAAAAKALGAGELEKLIVTKADLDGYDVRPADTGDRFAASKDQVTVADAKCQPIAYVLTGFAPGDESAYVNRMVTEKSTKPTASGTSDEDLENAMDGLQDVLDSTMTIVSLSSYDGGGAEETMKSVTDAVGGCAGGFTVSAKGQDTQTFTEVAGEKSSGTGDQSVAFAVTSKVEGGTTTVHAEVVRHGSTVATYYTLSLAALAGKKDTYDIPADVVRAQAAKLK
ncbi:hypothetical protein ACH4ZX_06395 [Streptomyces sp. NPDC020490]|uniref:hypothetical protein n=1 Tax=Streptomyces sp. NPDC020490 TaxID=3365078 RepID=UPI0037A28E70